MKINNTIIAINTHFNNNFKYQWPQFQFSNQKIQADWKDQKPKSIYCLRETHLSFKLRNHLWVKRWTNETRKQAVIAVIISDKIDFELKLTRQDEEGYFILTKGTVSKDNNTALNISAQKLPGPLVSGKQCTIRFKNTD